MKRLLITDIDLDGVGCAIQYKWMYHTDVDVEFTSITKLSNKIHDLRGRNLDKYDQIIFADLDISQHIKHIADLWNDLLLTADIKVIDHHDTNNLCCDSMRDMFNSVVVIDLDINPGALSSTQQIYKSFVEINEELYTVQRKRLIFHISDYDSFKLLDKKNSFGLNIIFGMQDFPRQVSFMKRFWNGFDKFTDQEENGIRLFYRDIISNFNKSEHYAGVIQEVDGFKPTKILGIVAQGNVCPTTMTLLLKDHGELNDFDGIMYVFGDKVSVRSLNKWNAAIFAETFLNGGGHVGAAGGTITPEILQILENFQPNQIRFP